MGCMPWIILCLWGFLCIRDAGHRGKKVIVYSGYKVTDQRGLQDKGHINVIVLLTINLVNEFFTAHHVACYWAPWWGKGGKIGEWGLVRQGESIGGPCHGQLTKFGLAKAAWTPPGFQMLFYINCCSKKFQCKKEKLNNTVDCLYSRHYRDLKLVSSLVRVCNNRSLFQSNICNYFCLGFSCCPYYHGAHYSEVATRWELT